MVAVAPSLQPDAISLARGGFPGSQRLPKTKVRRAGNVVCGKVGLGGCPGRFCRQAISSLTCGGPATTLCWHAGPEIARGTRLGNSEGSTGTERDADDAHALRTARKAGARVTRRGLPQPSARHNEAASLRLERVSGPDALRLDRTKLQPTNQRHASGALQPKNGTSRATILRASIFAQRSIRSVRYHGRISAFDRSGDSQYVREHVLRDADAIIARLHEAGITHVAGDISWSTTSYLVERLR